MSLRTGQIPATHAAYHAYFLLMACLRKQRRRRTISAQLSHLQFDMPFCLQNKAMHVMNGHEWSFIFKSRSVAEVTPHLYVLTNSLFSTALKHASCAGCASDSIIDFYCYL